MSFYALQYVLQRVFKGLYKCVIYNRLCISLYTLFLFKISLFLLSEISIFSKKAEIRHFFSFPLKFEFFHNLQKDFQSIFWIKTQNKTLLFTVLTSLTKVLRFVLWIFLFKNSDFSMKVFHNFLPLKFAISFENTFPSFVFSFKRFSERIFQMICCIV